MTLKHQQSGQRALSSFTLSGTSACCACKPTGQNCWLAKTGKAAPPCQGWVQDTAYILHRLVLKNGEPSPEMPR